MEIALTNLTKQQLVNLLKQAPIRSVIENTALVRAYILKVYGELTKEFLEEIKETDSVVRYAFKYFGIREDELFYGCLPDRISTSLVKPKFKVNFKLCHSPESMDSYFYFQQNLQKKEG